MGLPHGTESSASYRAHLPDLARWCTPRSRQYSPHCCSHQLPAASGRCRPGHVAPCHSAVQPPLYFGLSPGITFALNIPLGSPLYPCFEATVPV